MIVGSQTSEQVLTTFIIDYHGLFDYSFKLMCDGCYGPEIGKQSFNFRH